MALLGCDNDKEVVTSRLSGNCLTTGVVFSLEPIKNFKILALFGCTTVFFGRPIRFLTVDGNVAVEAE